MAARRFVVRGRVQGVGFRWFVVREAARLAVRGWTRNLPDGSVEVVAAGEQDALDALCRRLGEGPPASRVAEVTATDAPQDEDLETLDRFDVRY